MATPRRRGLRPPEGTRWIHDVEVPPRRYAAVRWAMDEWAQDHAGDVLTATVACSLVLALAAYLATF